VGGIRTHLKPRILLVFWGVKMRKTHIFSKEVMVRAYPNRLIRLL